MKRNNKKYQVQLPTAQRVVQMFDYERHDVELVDKSNCIMLTKLVEFIADNYQVSYEDEDYAKIEEACCGAYKRLMKRGDFNE